MLDDSSAALGILESLSEKLNSLMHYNGENMLDHFVEQYGEPLNVVKDTLRDIGNPYCMMCEIKSLIDKVIEQIEEKLIDMGVERELMGSYR